jgi:hypothetical protein
MRRIEFGRADNHGPNPSANTRSYISQILIDCSNAKFPLLPGK